MAQNIGFTRWYDRIPELSQAVRLLESVQSPNLELICESILKTSSIDNTGQHTHGAKELGAQKVLGLMKSKSKRRWYDQHPIVHQAFNTLYKMDDSQRYQTAIRILLAIQAAEKALNDPELQKRNINGQLLKGLINNIFHQSTQELMSKVKVVHKSRHPGDMQPANKPDDLSLETKRPDSILDMTEGMKLSSNSLSSKNHLI